MDRVNYEAEAMDRAEEEVLDDIRARIKYNVEEADTEIRSRT